MLCHFTKFFTPLCVDGSLHPLAHIPEIHAHASRHVAQALPFDDVTLVSCRQLRTALFGWHTSPHDEVGVAIPFGQLSLQSFPRLNMLHGKGHIDVGILPCRQKQFSRIVVEMCLNEVAKCVCPLHTLYILGCVYFTSTLTNIGIIWQTFSCLMFFVTIKTSFLSHFHYLCKNFSEKR